MANYDLPTYSTGLGGLAKPIGPEVRYMEVYVDLSSDVTMTTATDTVDIFQLPPSAQVFGGGIEQITAGDAGNTLALRVGTTSISAALASDATAGTVTATVPAALPLNVGGTAVDVNLLSATAARTTGVIRIFVTFMEGKRRTGEAGLATRDNIAGTA